jgi:NlpC/P60 family putative phage cell wall peptidase
VNVEELRLRIVEEARSWIGTAYHHRAWIKGVGVDCLWLLIKVYQTVGIVPPEFDPGNYTSDWYLHRDEELYLGGVQHFAHEIAGPPLPGDVAMFKVGRCVAHGAICIGNDSVVHANRKHAVVDVATFKELSYSKEGTLHSFWSCF